MKVKDLIDILETADPNAEIYVRYMNGDAYGSAWVDYAWVYDRKHIVFDKDGCVCIDIVDN